MWSMDPEIFKNKTLWILLGCGLVLSIILDYMNTKRKLKDANKNIDDLQDELSFCKKCSSDLIDSNNNLNKQIQILEEEADGVDEFTYRDEKIQINPIFKGKRALVADYDDYSSKSTRTKLRSLGLYVDIVRSGFDVINKINNGYCCDIIITNNVFKDSSSGEMVLSAVKEHRGNIPPVVIHTVSHNERNNFISLGFDEYLEKPATQETFKKVLLKLLPKKGTSKAKPSQKIKKQRSR